MTDVYQRNGYASRDAYFSSLAASYGVSVSLVRMFANLLGPEEDFDGLITDIEAFVALSVDEESE